MAFQDEGSWALPTAFCLVIFGFISPLAVVGLSDGKKLEHRSTKERAVNFESVLLSFQLANAAVGAMYIWGLHGIIA